FCRVKGSSDEEPAGGEGLSEEVYEVEKILDHNDTDEGLFYLVRWKGFGEEDDSWEPSENLALAVKAINEYEERRKSKSKGKKSKTPKSKSKSKGQEKQQKSKKGSRRSSVLVDDKSESEPEIPSCDDDDEYLVEKSTKKSGRVSTYSGTVTKAALKSYSPTTTNASKSTPTSTRAQTVDTISAAKKVRSAELQALQMRQSWLYDSDSDDDSGPEKENEKKKKESDKDGAKDMATASAEEGKHEETVEKTPLVAEPQSQKVNDRKRKVNE
ncbi:unnamed protein product, partial [Strongylus vulgaris]